MLGVEALVRWQHPQRGLLPPVTFIPVAERTGLIHPLTDVVLDLALCAGPALARRGHAQLPVAVNVSTRTPAATAASPKGADRRWACTACPPALLGLEITETTIMEDPERALAVLTRLAAAGVRLSIDDFGTGYSSLAYLKNLPVHELKIDRTFVAALTTSERDRVIVDSTVALGQPAGAGRGRRGSRGRGDPGGARRAGLPAGAGLPLQPSGACSRPAGPGRRPVSVAGGTPVAGDRPGGLTVPPIPRGTSAPTLTPERVRLVVLPVGKPVPVTC